MTASTGSPQPGAQGPAAGRDWGEWIREHTREVMLAIGGVAIVVAAGWLYLTSEARKESFAAQALNKARGDAQAGDLSLAVYDLSQLMDRYGGTKAADEGAVLLNQVRLVQGGPQTDAAVKALQGFVQKSHPDYIMASAWSLLGGGLEQEKKYREASDAYKKASLAAPYDFLKAQNLLDAGRTLAIAGDSAGARAAYGEVLEKYGALNQAAEARVRMGELGGTVPAPKEPAAGDQKAG